MFSVDQKELKAEDGFYFLGGIGSSFDLDGIKLSIDGNYTERQLNIENAQQTSKELGISTNFGWSF